MEAILFLLIKFTLLQIADAERDRPQTAAIQLTWNAGPRPFHRGFNVLALESLDSVSESDGRDIYLNPISGGYFTGNVQVGSPPRTFSVLFDTGSPLMWLSSSKTCAQYQTYCDTHSTYDSGCSKTYQNVGRAFDIKYDNGFIQGSYLRDDIYIANIKLNNFLFGEATEIDNGTRKLELEGIVGMRFNSSTLDLPFNRMVRENLVKTSVFAFYISRNESKVKSELTIGGIDSKRYFEPITYVPVFTNFGWGIKLDKLILCGRKIEDNFTVVLDSGTFGIIAPFNLTEQINKKIDGKYDAKNNFYVIDCAKRNRLPAVTIVIQNKEFTLDGEDYIKKVRLPENDQFEVCISTFFGNDHFNFLILGDTFTRKFYTVYDLGQKRLGFALAKHL